MNNSQKAKCCCICFETKDCLIECKHCEGGIYCSKCLKDLNETDMISSCSVCRQNNWIPTEYADNIVISIDNHPSERQSQISTINNISEYDHSTLDCIDINVLPIIKNVLIIICTLTTIGAISVFALFLLSI